MQSLLSADPSPRACAEAVPDPQRSQLSHSSSLLKVKLFTTLINISPFPSPPQLPFLNFLALLSHKSLTPHKSKSNPGRALKETLESKGHFKVILS